MPEEVEEHLELWWTVYDLFEDVQLDSETTKLSSIDGLIAKSDLFQATFGWTEEKFKMTVV